MIKKIILSIALLISTSYGSGVNTLHTESSTMNETVNLHVWSPSIPKMASGDSCDDGNCISDLNCFTKDGLAYNFFSYMKDKVKKQIKKL